MLLFDVILLVQKISFIFNTCVYLASFSTFL